MRRLLCSLLLTFGALAGWAADPAPVGPWNRAELYRTPQTFPAPPEYHREGVESVMYAGPAYHGKPTRVYAYVGIPAHPAGTKVPGMVLIHGGGGTAFPEWVKLWNSRGYAAIAMDTCGSLPGGEHSKRPRHEWGGPAGWGGWEQGEEAITDQWNYHAVADVLLAHSLLRSRPEVDAERIGVTGISWGGYLTCMVAGIDDRFRFAAPVYGCGYLPENSTWLPQFAKLSPTALKNWQTLWEPSQYLGRAQMPMLWVTGTNDFAFPMDSLQRSYRLPKGPRYLSIRPRMPHGQSQGAEPKEILALAEHVLKGGPDLPQLGTPLPVCSTLQASLGTTTGVVKAELHFTKATGVWKDRVWETVSAEIHSDGRGVSGTVPNSGTVKFLDGATVAFLSVTDAEGRVYSSEHLELKK